MNVIQGKHLGPWKVLGPGPGVCQECAIDHKPEQPHNAQSLAYQYFFYNEHGRWPNWKDAWAHCSEDVQAHWKRELSALKVDWEAGRIRP